MSIVRLGDNLSEVLANAKETVTIRAGDGRVVGTFEPFNSDEEIPCPYSDSELEEFRVIAVWEIEGINP